MDCTICHFEIPADDLEKAGAFYRTLFGWEVVAVGQGDDAYMLVTTSQRPGSLGGGLSRRCAGHDAPIVYVSVSSIETTLGKLVELGGEVLMQRSAIPEVGWVATARDPQGNTIGLFQEDDGAGLTEEAAPPDAPAGDPAAAPPDPSGD